MRKKAGRPCCTSQIGKKVGEKGRNKENKHESRQERRGGMKTYVRCGKSLHREEKRLRESKLHLYKYEIKCV